MPRLDERPDTYLTTVRGMCRGCRRAGPARVFLRDGKVWQESLCPDCDHAPALIAGDATWYLEEALRGRPDRSPIPGAHPPSRGCPNDCGPCTWHASPCQLPVVSITNACNLDCPICFTYNRKDRLWHMPVETMRRTVDAVVAGAGRVDLINVTGGEPTLHPDLFAILDCCRRPEIGRVTMNSNGLRLAADPALCDRLAELGVCVILSFSAFDRETSLRLHGRDVVAEKLRAVENLARAGCRMTLLQVMVRDVNEAAAGRLLDLMRRHDHILSLTVQTMTYTGQGGGRWPGRAHLPVDEAARIVARESGGQIDASDFLPRPSAHPLCYLTSYLLKAGDRFLPFARFAARERLEDLMRDSYLMRVGDGEAFFRDAVNTLHARGESEGLRVLRALVESLHPKDGPLDEFARQRRAEAAVRTVYLHAHMDEDTFDCARAMSCPDLVPSEPGRLIPACTYNLFYRMQDERFFVPDAGAAPNAAPGRA
jgi:uncharacterized radical SAM superfamily Fe-S cluster-containing enzyme